jgi:predicted RNA binding protein YcfA (HicA-like mRNA interferase family)
MTRHDILLARLRDTRRSFTWRDLDTLLGRLGYQRAESRGSRVRFCNGDPAALICLHRPHPGNELKLYARRQILAALTAGELI